MTWGEIASWLSFALAAIIGAERAVHYMLRSRYVSHDHVEALKDQILGLDRAMHDEQMDQDRAYLELKGEHDKLRQRVEDMPTNREIMEKFHTLEEGQAVGRQKMDNLKEGLDRVTRVVERIDGRMKE